MEKVIILFLLGYLIDAVAMDNFEDCKTQFAQTLGSEITIKDILPANVTEELAKKGALHFNVNTVDFPSILGLEEGILGKEIQIVQNGTPIVQLSYGKSAAHPDRIYIGNMFIDDRFAPLLKKGGYFPEQGDSRDLSLARYMVSRMAELGRNENAKEIVAPGPGNYSDYLEIVLKMKFQALDKEAESTARVLEENRKFISSLPAPLRSIATQSYTASLGESGQSRVSPSLEKLWNHYQRSGQLPKEAKVFKDDKARDRVLVVTQNGQTEFYYVDFLKVEPTLLDWNQLLEDGKLNLKRTTRPVNGLTELK